MENGGASLKQHYQQIQALAPTEESLAISPEESSLSLPTFLGLSFFIFFFVVIFLGFLPLILERFRDFRRFQMSLLLAFVAGALPLTLGMVLTRTGVLTKASALAAPRHVTITEVTADSFRVSWGTENEQYGALRYGSEPYSEALTTTVLEEGGLLRSTNHAVVVDNLTPDTDYYFEILSGPYWYDNAGVLLAVHTLPREDKR